MQSSRPALVVKKFLLDAEKRGGQTPLSFELVPQAYRHEYARRFAEYTKAGGKPWPVEPPPMANPEAAAGK